MTRAKTNDMIRRTQTYAILDAGRIDTPGCVQLSTYNRLVWKVRIQADPDNTASVFVGNQMKHPYELIPGAELEIPIDFLYKIYVRITAGDAVNWWAMGSVAQVTRFPSAYTKKVADTGPIAYWTQGDPLLPTAVDQVDSPAQDGTYMGVALGQQGIGDGLTSPLYDGVTDYTIATSAAFQAVFNGSEGTVAAWGRARNIGLWTDGNAYHVLRIGDGGAIQNIVWVYKVAPNTIRFRYRAGGTDELIDRAGTTTLDWFYIVGTWSASAGVNGEARMYWNGAQHGATAVALGVWAGAPPPVFIGAQNGVPATPWSGWLSHVAVWDRPLTPAEVADLYIVPGP